MEISSEAGVRQYKKSALPRLRWTPELHEHFVQAVEHLGGKHKATPKRIVQVMGVRGLRTSHVKSHLQMHRSMRKRATINLVLPATAVLEEDTADVLAWSQFRNDCKGQQQKEKTMEAGNPITCRSKTQTIQMGKNVFNPQVMMQISANSDVGKQNQSEIVDFLREAIEDVGKRSSLWCFDHPPISRSSVSSNCFDLLLYSGEDNSQVNLDLAMSSCY